MSNRSKIEEALRKQRIREEERQKKEGEKLKKRPAPGKKPNHLIDVSED